MADRKPRRNFDIALLCGVVVTYALVQVFDKPDYPKPDLPEYIPDNNGPFEPTKSYHQTTIANWGFHISREIYGNSDDYPRMLYHLEQNITRADALIPEFVKARLQPMFVWVEEASNSSYAGQFFHPIGRDVSTNPDKRGNIEINIYRRYIANPIQLQNTFVHEIAHAYHNSLSMQDKRRITAQFQKAEASAAFQNANIRDGLVSTQYALTNAWEYFAELSAAYIMARDSRHPSLRKLYEIDPEGMKMIERFWTER